MIRINLLPVSEKKRRALRRTPEGREPGIAGPGVSPFTIIILVICFALVAVLAYLIYMQKVEDERLLQEKRDQVKYYEDEISKIQKDYVAIKKLLDLTTNQIEILRALDPPNRILWSEKLNMLAELVPDGIYLTRIKVDEEVKEVETEDSKRQYKQWLDGGKKGARPPAIKKPIITQTLYLYGISRAELPEDRLRLISSFSEALKTFSWKNREGEVRSFFEHFAGEIDTSELVVTRIEGVSVTQFTFIMKTKSFTT